MPNGSLCVWVGLRLHQIWHCKYSIFSETFVDLNLSRDQLFSHCSPRHAWVADHVSHQSDITINTANYTTQHHTLRVKSITWDQPNAQLPKGIFTPLVCLFWSLLDLISHRQHVKWTKIYQTKSHVTAVAHLLVIDYAFEVGKERAKDSLFSSSTCHVIQNGSKFNSKFASPHNCRNHLGHISKKDSQGKWNLCGSSCHAENHCCP